MTKANNKTMEYKSKQGNKFMFQKVTPSKWLDILDESDSGGTRSRAKLYPAVLENVVVQPSGLKPDDFEEEGRGGFYELDEVVGAAIRFQQSQ